MLKLIFWSLLAANAALFAYGQGYLGTGHGDEREPARMKKQFNTEGLTLLAAQDANAKAASARQAAQAPKPEPIACIEIGNFLPADAKRFEKQLEALELGDRQSRQNVVIQENPNHIVYIPPLGSKEAADKKANELKQLGVTNYFVMSDNTSMKWGISLGVFKSEAAAQSLLQALIKQGVHSARVIARGTPANRLAYQFRAIEPDTRARLETIKAAYPQLEMHTCK